MKIPSRNWWLHKEKWGAVTPQKHKLIVKEIIMTNFLTQDDIARKAPSVFTQGSYEKTGTSYVPISTFSILKGLFDLGFGVTHALESRVRNKDRAGFSRHMLRLRRQDEQEINGNFPELVLVNAHDGSTSYQLRVGVYRLVCSNGMVVGNDVFCQRVRHQGDVIGRVAEAGREIIDIFPTVIEKTVDWSKIELSPQQQIAFANSAKTLKWDPQGNTEVLNEDLIRPKRSQDQSADLWTTFNVIQENLIKGGVTTRNKETRERRKSRPVNSPYENNRLNMALWQLTEHMASLAK